MSYQALYRVWRPQLLEDVVGQVHITKTLQNALLQQKMAHAYLFSGPRGTGKTSAAKIIAKAINCEHAPVAEPCNECSRCIGITNGSIIDVMEIDAASNNGVDEIRDIREKVKYAPTETDYKVYIIDEVHMLSTGAFNALLKTLEEPPAHVIFILATTEPHKIPLTILSRCQRFDFKPITNEELVSRMKRILDHNGQAYDEDAIDLIAQAADGGMRDALSLLDQAISFSGDRVAVKDVLVITGSVSREALNNLVGALAQDNARLALETIDETLRNGKDPKRLLEDLILYFRDLLLYKTAPEAHHLLERAKVEESFIAVAKQYEVSKLHKVIQKLTSSQQEIKWALKPKIILEMAIINVMEIEDAPLVPQQNQDVEELRQQIEKLQAQLKQGPPIAIEEQQSTQRKPQTRPRSSGGKGKSPITAQVKEIVATADKNELQETISKWANVKEQLKGISVPAHAWLNDCKPVAASSSKILLAFQNEMHRDMMDTKFRDVLNQVLQQVYGGRSNFSTLLQSQWEQVKTDYMKDKENEQPQDPFMEEAVKLVGEDLIEVIDS
ncbi:MULTISPECIES: DNA polymerase III subunit gamma/tau [Bacillaceae]|uniref:DNA-directed DNA polymerase n=1 Tax=Alkalicoccobacillus plakortidis TaxID=444060 RepID=A0A9D5DJZ0_9BACI|nr:MULTISPECIES: DNA polymerase III subunit gamma/tau [Bacillaceae]KQL50962.1 DNA polymerase III subunit gamma/tau [Alkalicoccobacillus plakortidis]